MLNNYVRYEVGKTKEDYYHAYMLQIPIEMWKDLSRLAKQKHCPISALVRSWIAEGLTNERYYG